MGEQLSRRDLIRSKTVGRKKSFRRSIAKIEIDGEEVEIPIRVPSVEEQQRIFKAGKPKQTRDAKGNLSVEFLDMLGMQVETILCCVCDDDGKQVYDRADVEAFKSEETDGWFQKLAAACSRHGTEPKRHCEHVAEEGEDSCGAELEDGFCFCPKCGAKTPEVAEAPLPQTKSSST